MQKCVKSCKKLSLRAILSRLHTMSKACDTRFHPLLESWKILSRVEKRSTFLKVLTRVENQLKNCCSVHRPIRWGLTVGVPFVALLDGSERWNVWVSSFATMIINLNAIMRSDKWPLDIFSRQLPQCIQQLKILYEEELRFTYRFTTTLSVIVLIPNKVFNNWTQVVKNLWAFCQQNCLSIVIVLE